MEIVILPDPGAVARFGSAVLADLVAEDAGRGARSRDRVSPLGIYAELAALVAAGDLDCAAPPASRSTSTWASPEATLQSYATRHRSEVVEPLRMDPSRVHVPDGRAADIRAACSAYEAAIRAAAASTCRSSASGERPHRLQRADLLLRVAHPHQDARSAHPRRQRPVLRLPPDEVPTHCFTQGLGTILEARAGPARRAGRRQGRRGRRAGRGSRHRPLARVRCCSTTRTRDRPVDEAAASGSAARRLLPLRLRAQARMAAGRRSAAA